MIPGRVVGISQSGARKYEITGSRDENEPMSQETAFDVGSVTKVLSTTAIILKMVQSGEIRLSHKVSEILPRWKSIEKQDITIADLLEHQSGLNEWKPLYIEHSSKDEAFEDIASKKLKYSPSSGRHYSDLGFITLGEIIESVKGEALDVIFTREIATPLGLLSTQYATPVDSDNVASTSFGDRIEKEMVESQRPYPVSVLSSDFSRWRAHRLNGEINDGNAFHLFKGVSGHAGLFSTVDDFLAFGESLMNSDSIFDDELVQLFTTPHRDPMQGYGFRNWKSGKYWGHTGFPGVALAIDFHARKVIAMMTNRIAVDGALTPTDQLLDEYLS